jgi:hypothetical protein
MLFNDTQIMGCGENAQTLWNKVITGKPWTDFDQIASLADIRHVLHQNQALIAIFRTQRVIFATFNTWLTSRASRRCFALTRLAGGFRGFC